MTVQEIAELERAMHEAAEREDFETAAALRNRLALARNGAEETSGGDFAGLKRQQPGAMGIGTQHPAPSRPEGWTKPRKPSPMTANTGRRGKR